MISGKQKEYVRGFRIIIERGCSLGRFNVESPRVASFAVLEMLNGLENGTRAALRRRMCYASTEISP